MPVSVDRLTDRAVRGLKEPGYHADGGGLYLQVTPGGSRSWIYRYSIEGRRREMGLGSFHDLNLAEARLARDEERRGLAKGADPLAGRRIRVTRANVVFTGLADAGSAATEFMVKLAASKGMSARALEFTILTVARVTMTLEATWREVSGDIWDLDASRMKERPFRQPLSAGALAVLSKVRPDSVRPNDLIFPAQKGGVMSNMAMDMLPRDLAPPWTPHGMRSTFRDWAGDETEFAREVIEECLAHAVSDETERAYRRSDALKKRKAVLDAWSAYCLSKLPCNR